MPTRSSVHLSTLVLPCPENFCPVKYFCPFQDIVQKTSSKFFSIPGLKLSSEVSFVQSRAESDKRGEKEGSFLLIKPHLLGHAVHTVLPAVSANVLAGHSIQTLDSLAVNVLEYLPVSHRMQSLSSSLPVVLRYLLAVHTSQTVAALIRSNFSQRQTN